MFFNQYLPVKKNSVADALCVIHLQMGCSCHQCDRARRQPGYKDGLVTCLGIVDEEEGKVCLNFSFALKIRQIFDVP